MPNAQAPDVPEPVSALSVGALVCILLCGRVRAAGESVPYSDVGVRKHMRYLSAEQALADYAELIMELRQQYNATTQVIGERQRQRKAHGGS